MMQKKIMAVAVALAAACCFAACGNDNEGTVTEPAPTAPVTTEPTTPEPTTTEPTTTEEIVTETEPEVTEPFIPTGTQEFNLEYFQDNCFIGDSVCSGLRVYAGLLTDKEVFAVGNAGARNIHDFMFTVDGAEYTITDAVNNKQPNEIFLWMGLNDINMTTKDVYAENLHKLAVECLEVSQNSKINVCGMTPTTTWHSWGANERIKEYNAAVEQMCSDFGYTYINTWSAVAEGLDYLPEECQSGDGLHLSPMAYKLVLGYITELKGMDNVQIDTPIADDTSSGEASSNDEQDSNTKISGDESSDAVASSLKDSVNSDDTNNIE